MALVERTDGDHGITRAEVSGARLLISDMGSAFLVFNEARYRTIERVLGVPRDQSWLVTLIALGMLAQAASDKIEQLRGGPPAPSLADTALAAAMLKEITHGVGGPSSRDMPLFGTVVAFGALGILVRPAVRWSGRGVRASSHRARLAFNHRYGHLIARRRRR